MTILETIVAHKREEVAARKQAVPLGALLQELPGELRPRDFSAALRDPHKPAPRVIAEVKRRSPSRGLLRPDLDAVGTARTYAESGAAAISVLADNRFFGGSLADLRAVCAAVELPVLCKEFIIDPYQVYEARIAGASAILLIAGILHTGEMRDLRALAASIGLSSLVEVHNEEELRSAVASDADIIGINNRDLHTFSVSLDTTRNLRRMVPAGITVVSESGIFSSEHRAFMQELDVHALLVGESLLTAPDVAAATREICGMAPAQLERSVR